MRTILVIVVCLAAACDDGEQGSDADAMPRAVDDAGSDTFTDHDATCSPADREYAIGPPYEDGDGGTLTDLEVYERIRAAQSGDAAAPVCTRR